MTMAEALCNNVTVMRKKRDLLLRSKRRWVLSTIDLVEEDQGPFPKSTTQMFNDRTTDEQGKHVFHISGMGVTDPPLGVFSIDENTGMVLVHKAIDREQYALFHINFDILNKATGINIDKTLSFDVAISDINDNAPTFDHPVMRASVKESTPEGLLPVRLQARDMDEVKTINSTFSMKVLSQEPKEPQLQVEQVKGSTVGQLSFQGCFNYDKVNKYKIIIEAKDHGKPPLSSTAVVNLNILDSNSHPPVFKARKYAGEILEMETGKEILRVAVEDKDTPNTPGWKAEYYFIKGNEDNNYKITTDPKTNEGILTVIKGRDFERTTNNSIQIGVRNEEPLYTCRSKKGGSTTPEPAPDSVNITLKVIDVNDAPKFQKNVTDVYLKEEEEPGQTLFKPKITDEDSDISNIRYQILEDPAQWARIDPITGVVRSADKMDRESPFVDPTNIYKIVVAAIDDGEPPATASSTILVHLRDINDNLPGLVNSSFVMCADKVNKVTIPAADKDMAPFSGPFSFALGDKTQKDTWKVDPATGEEGGLVALKSLPYGNYSVSLVIQDQQGMIGEDTVVTVVVCDCDGRDSCRGKLPLAANVSGAVIGLIIAALLLPLLMLLLIFKCDIGKQFQPIAAVHDEGNQTLIKYNEEGGGSACKTEPTFPLTPTSSMTAKNGLKLESVPISHMYQMISQENSYQASGRLGMLPTGSLKHGQPREFQRGQGGGNRYSTWNSNLGMSIQNGSHKFSQNSSMHSDQLIAYYLEEKLYALQELPGDYPLYRPIEYTYEGQGSRSESLDELSLDLSSNLDFLSDLGPKFKTLGGLCRQSETEKNVQL